MNSNNEQPKMHPEQYRAICEMISQNDEDNKRLIKDVKGTLSQEIGTHMTYIRESITDMNCTLKTHNSRLRKMEAAEERRKGRDELLVTQLATVEKEVEGTKERLKKQIDYCGKHLVKTEDLSVLGEWIEWIKKHPFKFFSLALPILFTVLVVANAVYHWFDKLL
jgi:chromosome segregation ATPase